MQLCPYLHLNGTSKEAMTFYKDILGGDLSLMTVGESGMNDQLPEGMPKGNPNNIMHSSLTIDGKMVLMASDMWDPSSFTQGDTVSVCIVCDSKAQIDEYYSKLSEGGDIFMKLSEESFGWFASFTDKFGVDWMLQFDSKLAK